MLLLIATAHAEDPTAPEFRIAEASSSCTMVDREGLEAGLSKLVPQD